MKVLKIVGLVIAIFIAIPLVAAIFISQEVRYAKSITINAPVEDVWQYVNTLSAMDEWSPWNEKDPNMEKKYSGTDGQVGAKSSWKSDHEDVGVGSQTIAELDAPNMIRLDLKFLTPYESEAQSYVKLTPVSGGTQATWGFESEIPYPFNFTKLFMSLDEQLDPDFTKGLTQLKELVEKG
ncbi:MAG: SRPBCC family protein [Flammeovirgaceae bacterium]